MKKIDLSTLEYKRSATEADVLLGKNIRKYRLIRNLSQKEVADLLGVKFQQIQKYESGANRVASSTLIRLSKILGINYTLLLDPLAEQIAPIERQTLSRKKKEIILEEEETELLTKLFRMKNSKNREKVLNILKALLD